MDANFFLGYENQTSHLEPFTFLKILSRIQQNLSILELKTASCLYPACASDYNNFVRKSNLYNVRSLFQGRHVDSIHQSGPSQDILESIFFLHREYLDFDGSNQAETWLPGAVPQPISQIELC